MENRSENSAALEQKDLQVAPTCFWSSLESHEQQRKDHGKIIHSAKGSKEKGGKKKTRLQMELNAKRRERRLIAPIASGN